MLFIVETSCLCLAFWGICYISTGTDEKNIRSFSTYPNKIQQLVKENPLLAPNIKNKSSLSVFLSNLLLFTPLLLILCFFVRTDSIFSNFLKVLIMGESLNAFDFLVIDMLWWRNTKRVRFSGTEELSSLYQNPKNHFISFVKGIVMFFISALIDGFILSLI